MEITQKVLKRELSYSYATHRHDLFYVTVKYYQNIPNGIKVVERTQTFLWTDRQRTDARLIAISPDRKIRVIKRGSLQEVIIYQQKLVELQWLEHSWLVFHGCFELVLGFLGPNPIVADLGQFREIFFLILRIGILCVLIRIASLRRF